MGEPHQTWDSIESNERVEFFQTLPRADAEDLFLNLESHDQAEILDKLGDDRERRSWLRLLAPDDAADLIQHYKTEEQRKSLVALLDSATGQEVEALLAYQEDEAGGLMNSRFVRLRPELPVEAALRYLRMQSHRDVETIYYAYVLDAGQKLLGVASLRELIQAAPGVRVQDVMRTDLVAVQEDIDQEQIAHILQRTGLMAVPVVDESGHMKGVVTFDDIIDVIREEATEDIHKIGGTEALDRPYFKTSFVEMMRKRAGWLVILFFGQMFTATAMASFEAQIAQAIVLVLFIPLIISSGGNSGSQASTLIIRAMAVGELQARDWLRVLGRESITGLSLGFILGIIGVFRIHLSPNKEALFGEQFGLLALTIGISLIGVVLLGTIVGSMLPFVLRHLRLDPASASAPFVATIVDVTGLVLYFTVAHAILGLNG